MALLACFGIAHLRSAPTCTRIFAYHCCLRRPHPLFRTISPSRLTIIDSPSLHSGGCAVLEQSCRTGSSSHQTPSECQAGLPRIPGGSANDSGLRSGLPGRCTEPRPVCREGLAATVGWRWCMRVRARSLGVMAFAYGWSLVAAPRDSTPIC